MQIEIEIKEVAADVPPLRSPASIYQPLYDRVEKLEVGERFRATLTSKSAADRARNAVRNFGEHKGMRFTINKVGCEIEIIRLESAQ